MGDVIFVAYGVPVGQGAHRVGRQGQIYESTVDHGTYRQELIQAAMLARQVARDAGAEEDGQAVITGPVEVMVTFCFPRLKSHYWPVNKSRPEPLLKPYAPLAHTTSPDLDHLQRTLGDALKIAGVIKDDALIAYWGAAKVYGELPGAYVQVRPLDEAELMSIVTGDLEQALA